MSFDKRRIEQLSALAILRRPTSIHLARVILDFWRFQLGIAAIDETTPAS